MRIYSDVFEMHSEVKRDLHEMGIIVHPQTMQDKPVANDPQYRTLELSPCVFTVCDIRSRDEWIKHLGLNLEWCKLDFIERLNGYYVGYGVNPGAAHELRPEWAEFLHDGKFAYTYSERLARSVDSPKIGSDWMTAVERIIHELRHRPDTRQAVLPIFDACSDLGRLGSAKRVPCSLHYQFLRRRGMLDLFYVMRSSDFITHFPYDIWQALQLQAFIAEELQIPPGPFTFFTGSLHLYAKDADPGVF